VARSISERLQRIEQWPPRRQAARPHFSLHGKGFGAVAENDKAVAELFADEDLGHLVQEHFTSTDLLRLVWREGRHDEAVADVDVELVAAGSPDPVRGAAET
jgi:hypothetical protein